MTKKIEPIGVWLALAVLGIVAIAVLPYRATTAQAENAMWVEHTHLVIESIDAIERQLLATTSARREFALTGDHRDLIAFASATKELREAESTVRGLTADNRAQQERLDRLEPLLAACHSAQERANAARTTEGFVAAREAATYREMEGFVAALEPLLAELVGEERRLLAKREVVVLKGLAYERWVHLLGTGASIALIGLAFVTLRRENERRLRSEAAAHVSEARFARLADSGIVGITITDLQGTFLEANDVFLEMIGYSREELEAGKVSRTSITPAEHREADQGAVRTLAETGIVALREKEYVRKDGSRVPVLVGGAMVTGDECIGFIADITERNRVEKALRISEVRFRRLMESGIMGIVVADTEGTITEANDAFLSMVGYSQQDLLDGALSSATLNAADPESANATALLKAQGFAPPWEMQLVRKDGARVPVLSGVAMLDDTSTLALVVDLTERKRAEESIRQLREERAVDARFRALLEAAPDAMVIADEEARIILVNAQAERLFGYPREEMLGRPARMLVPARRVTEHVERWTDYFRDASAPARPMGGALELVGLRKDGSEVPIEVRHSPLQTEQGRLISSSIRDITERRLGEEKLRQSDERLRLLVESIKDYAILMLDPDGRVRSWNEGAERITGYTGVEIIGQSFATFYPREVRETKPRDELVTAARVGQIEDEGWRIRKDGSRFWANTLITAVRGADGGLVGFAKVTRDLSERRRAEQALQLANRELSSFSYSVAHDLRAPLRGMNGFAQVLLDRYSDKLDAEGQDFLNEILLNARKMGLLIDALLSLSRVTRTDLKRERVDLSQIVRAAAARLAAADPHRAVDVVVPDVMWADMDAPLARALVDNLLENAWKFTSRAAHPRIEVGVDESDGAEAAFFVRDNGAGFDMAFADKLFGAFQRLHSEAEFPGTGIGLATVQRIVHRHGGRVWAEGQVERGAAFHFTLPTQTTPTTP